MCQPKSRNNYSLQVHEIISYKKFLVPKFIETRKDIFRWFNLIDNICDMASTNIAWQQLTGNDRFERLMTYYDPCLRENLPIVYF